MDEEHIKQRKKDATPDVSNSAPLLSSTTTTSIPNVIQTKEEYFEALRIWLQQVQLQQTAMAYFPYYLAANYQQSVGGSASFLPPQFPAMFPDASTQMPNGANLPNIGVTTQQINVDQQPAQPHPIFVNNLFQQNRNNNNNNNNNNYVDNTRRNLEGKEINSEFSEQNSKICLYVFFAFNCSHSTKRWIRVCYCTHMEAFCCRNDRCVDIVHHQTDGRLYDYRYLRC